MSTPIGLKPVQNYEIDTDCVQPGDDGLGEERVSYNSTVYTASGVWLESKKEDLHTVEIPVDIWNKLTINDELMYKESAMGGPSDFQIAQ